MSSFYSSITSVFLIIRSVSICGYEAGLEEKDSGDNALHLSQSVTTLQQQMASQQELITSQQQQLESQRALTDRLLLEVNSQKNRNELLEHQMKNQFESLTTDNGRLARLFEDILEVAKPQQHEGNAGETTADDKKVRLLMDATGGSTYVRWGRTTCDLDATVLYSGYAAIGGNSKQGGAGDMLCLHSQPQYNYTTGGGCASSTLFGVEYEFHDVPFSTRNNGGQTFLNGDMPCAVCHVRKRSHQLMIPGRNTCPSGWVREYWGFLVSTYDNNYKGAIVCVDNGPEAIPWSYANNNPHTVFPVKTTCLGINCPPYVAELEISCTVCSK